MFIIGEKNGQSTHSISLYIFFTQTACESMISSIKNQVEKYGDILMEIKKQLLL